MSRNVWIGLALVVLILTGWFLLRPKQKAETAPANVSTPPISESTAAATEEVTIQASQNAVTITSAGFSPQEITVKVGESVTWLNAGSEDHQVNSAPHPTHTAYQPLNTVGLLKSADKKSLTFPTAGTYKYHDHLNPSLFGSVTVQ